MSNQETRASTGRYAPSVSYNQQAPQPINQRLQSKVDVKSPDWVSTGIQAIESFGKIYGKVKETEAAAQAEAALNTAKNDLARQANMIAEEQRQTGMSAATAASRYRMLADNALAGGTLTEKDIADVIGRYDGGILNIDQSRQQKIMEDDQKYWENQSQEIADKNPALSRMQPSDRTKLLMEMRTLTDDVNKYRGWMSSLPEGDEKESAKAYYNQLMGSNIKVNMAVQLGNMFAQSKVVNEEDWVALRAQAVQACLDNGMDRATAGVLVDEVANSYSVTGDLTDIKRYFKDNTNYLEAANKMILANAENKVVSLPGLALLQAMPQELQKSMLNQNWPTYQLLTRPFLANVGTDSNGNKYLEGLDRISPNFVAPLAQAVNNMNSSGMYNDYVRGKATGIALSTVNSVNQLSPTSSASDAGVVALNSDGTRQYINFNLSRKQADTLLRSDDPEEVATGEFLAQELDKAEEQQWLANNIPTADTIVKTLTNRNGGDEEAYQANNSLKNSTNAASLRFNDNGELFISDADRSTLAELGYNFDRLPFVGGEYEEELATINNKLSTLEPEMRKLVLTRAGYKQAAEGELPIAERRNRADKAISSTFGGKRWRDYADTPEEFGAKALGIKPRKTVKVVEEPEEDNLTSEETKAESREMNKDLFEPVTYSASTKSSETLANASVIGTPDLEKKLKAVNRQIRTEEQGADIYVNKPSIAREMLEKADRLKEVRRGLEDVIEGSKVADKVAELDKKYNYYNKLVNEIVTDFPQYEEDAEEYRKIRDNVSKLISKLITDYEELIGVEQ